MNKQCVFCHCMVPMNDCYQITKGHLEVPGSGYFKGEFKRRESACGSCMEDAKRIFQAKAAIVATKG